MVFKSFKDRLAGLPELRHSDRRETRGLQASAVVPCEHELGAVHFGG